MADTNGVLQKFSIFSYEATANVSGRMSGVAIHPNGKIYHCWWQKKFKYSMMTSLLHTLLVVKMLVALKT